MTGVRARARQIVIIAGILVLILLLGPAFVPQELRADAALRLAGLAQYLDTSFSDAWQTAFGVRASDHRGGVSASHSGAPLVLTGGPVHPSEAVIESSIDLSDIELASFKGGYGFGSNGLPSDMLKDSNLGASGDFEAFAGGSGSGNVPGGSGGDRYAGGTGGSAGGAAPATQSRSASNKGSSAASRGRHSEGNVRLADVKSDHRDRGLGYDSGSAFAGDAWWKQVASGQSLNALAGNHPGVGDWGSGHHDGGAGYVLDPTDGDVVGQLLNGSGNSDQGEDHRGPGFHGDGNGADSDGGDGHLADPPPLTEPVSGPVSSVPEPGSLVLLSSGLIAIMLWRKFRPVR